MTAHSSIAGIPLVLGGNVFGFTADEDASFAILDRFYEHGGRMVDTAQGYSVWVPGHVGGESEAVIGKWLASRGVRAEMRIATKTGMFGKPGDLTPERVHAELQRSLERLQCEYVHLYYAHRDEPETPLEEVAQGFDALVKSGQVREIGLSNYGAGRLRAMCDITHSNGTTPFTILQNEYNLENRADEDVLLTCEKDGIAFIPWYPLGAGSALKSGKVKRIAARLSATPSQVAIAWLLAHSPVMLPIPGTSSLRHLEENAAAAELRLLESDLAELA